MHERLGTVRSESRIDLRLEFGGAILPFGTIFHGNFSGHPMDNGAAHGYRINRLGLN